MKKRSTLLSVFINPYALMLPCLAFSAGCKHNTETPQTSVAAEPVRSLRIALLAKSDSQLSGEARFTEQESGTLVELSVQNTNPGLHGAHIHEKNDCSAPDASSAGSHYNPHQHAHGLPNQEARHLGDLGNLEVSADGTGKLSIIIANANLEVGSPQSLLGRAIVVHASPDDGSQPVGNSGARIGCGEIPNEIAPATAAQ